MKELIEEFNNHKKEVFEETKREILGKVMEIIKKRCTDGYNTTAFRLKNEGKANKAKLLLEQLGFTCEIIKRSDENDRYYGAPDGCEYVRDLWVNNYGCESTGHVFYLKVKWSFDYE